MDHQLSSPNKFNNIISSFSSKIYYNNSTCSSKPSFTKKLRSSPSIYKGVIPQSNGRWGAQLYEGNKRFWVGTFDNQELAARAYDIVVIRFRGPQRVSNFPIHYYTLVELEFIASLSKAHLVDTLRTHAFQDELARFIRTRIPMNSNSNSNSSSNREWLFEKVLTPSDIGKLNRLVVLTKYARKYFPEIASVGKGGMMMSFEDGRKEKVWKFKYCYWSGSQNYVLTRGWGEFVRNRDLRTGDIVKFYATGQGKEKRFYIDSSSSLLIKPSTSDDIRVDDYELERFKKLRLFGVDLCPIVHA